MPDYEMNWEIETELDESGEKLICGCDEAGRGPLAGPVCGAAVILPRGIVIEGLNDSKKLSEKKREILFDRIKEEAIAWAVCLIQPEEIDEINILNAALLSMKRSVESLSESPDYILIDGNMTRGFGDNAFAVVKGDARSPNIAAASILAKVTRDRLMVELDAKYPGYGFAVHKGYPTKAHYEAIRNLGPCPIHRKTFLKKMH